MKLEITDLIETVNYSTYKSFSTQFLTKLGFTNIQFDNFDDENVLIGNANINIAVISQKFAFIFIRNENLVDLKYVKYLRSKIDKFTDKGIIFTTGKFTRTVKKERKKRGETPIDLINLEGLQKRLKTMEINLDSATN